MPTDPVEIPANPKFGDLIPIEMVMPDGVTVATVLWPACEPLPDRCVRDSTRAGVILFVRDEGKSN
jgi:hypothetical protein